MNDKVDRFRPYAISGYLMLAAIVSGCEGTDPVSTNPGPSVGTLIVSNTTNGASFDPDGYEIRIDGALAAVLGPNDSVEVAHVIPGSHAVELTGMASNCWAGGGASRKVSVPGGSAARIEFFVTCTPTPPEPPGPGSLSRLRVVYARVDREAHTSTLMAMNADGGGKVVLISGGFFYGPDVSPDGSRILFMRDSDSLRYAPDIYAMNADGSGITRLVAGPAYDPRWSPDGSEIVYGTGEGWWGGALHVMNADGSRSRQISGPDPFPEDAWPRWSPDGTRVVFTRSEKPLEWGNYLSIWMVRKDGTDLHRVTIPYGGAFPVWSAAGDRIAFVGMSAGTIEEGGIALMNADGSGVTPLLQSGPDLRPHDWSPDGSLLLFTKSVGPQRTDIFLLRVEDGTVTRLTAEGDNWTPAFW